MKIRPTALLGGFYVGTGVPDGPLPLITFNKEFVTRGVWSENSVSACAKNLPKKGF